jgi:hypothetical protein
MLVQLARRAARLQLVQIFLSFGAGEKHPLMLGFASGLIAFGAFSEFFQVNQFAHQDDVLAVGDENKTVMATCLLCKALVFRRTSVFPELALIPNSGLDATSLRDGSVTINDSDFTASKA